MTRRPPSASAMARLAMVVDLPSPAAGAGDADRLQLAIGVGELDRRRQAPIRLGGRRPWIREHNQRPAGGHRRQRAPVAGNRGERDRTVMRVGRGAHSLAGILPMRSVSGRAMDNGRFHHNRTAVLRHPLPRDAPRVAQPARLLTRGIRCGGCCPAAAAPHTAARRRVSESTRQETRRPGPPARRPPAPSSAAAPTSVGVCGQISVA